MTKINTEESAMTSENDTDKSTRPVWLDDVVSAINDLRQKVNSLQNGIAGLDTRLTGLDTRTTDGIAGLDTRLTGLDTRTTDGIAGLKTDVKGLKTDSIRLDDGIEQVGRDIRLLSRRTSRLERSYDEQAEFRGRPSGGHWGQASGQRQGLEIIENGYCGLRGVFVED